MNYLRIFQKLPKKFTKDVKKWKEVVDGISKEIFVEVIFKEVYKAIAEAFAIRIKVSKGIG